MMPVLGLWSVMSKSIFRVPRGIGSSESSITLQHVNHFVLAKHAIASIINTTIMPNRFGGLPEYDPRRDDSPSSIDAIKRAIGLSPARNRNRQPRQENGGPAVNRFLFKQDHRARLPSWIARFVGYRREKKGPFDPIAPLSFLKSVPMKYEVWVLGWIASFVGILLILSIFATHTAFRDTFHSPLVVASFGATAVLIYGAVESPLSQPRNVFGGQIFSAIVAVAITRLFVKDPAYIDHLDNTAFHPAPFINGALCMATAMLVMTMTGTVHPP